MSKRKKEMLDISTFKHILPRDSNIKCSYKYKKECVVCGNVFYTDKRVRSWCDECRKVKQK